MDDVAAEAMPVFWIRSMNGTPDRRVIHLVTAPSCEAARAMFGPLHDRPGGQIFDCTTPYLVAEARDHPDGVVWERAVDTYPSVTDEFRLGDTFDYQAMEDAGFDRT